MAKVDVRCPFSFRAFREDEPVLLAVGHLQAFYRGRKLPNRVPLDFMSRKWQRRVSPVGKNTDLQAWEVAVSVHLWDRLKTGDIWVDGSLAWQSFEDYLLPRHVSRMPRRLCQQELRLRLNSHRRNSNRPKVVSAPATAAGIGGTEQELKTKAEEAEPRLCPLIA